METESRSGEVLDVTVAYQEQIPNLDFFPSSGDQPRGKGHSEDIIWHDMTRWASSFTDFIFVDLPPHWNLLVISNQHPGASLTFTDVFKCEHFWVPLRTRFQLGPNMAPLCSRLPHPQKGLGVETGGGRAGRRERSWRWRHRTRLASHLRHMYVHGVTVGNHSALSSLVLSFVNNSNGIHWCEMC